MATTDAITAYAAQTQAAQSANQESTTKSATELDIDDFLTLMTTQLQNQDPMNPLESTDFVAQIAQFGTVSGIQEMTDTVTALSDSLRASQALQGTSLVGHSVLVSTDTVTLTEGNTVAGQLEVPSGASSVTVSVTDASGQLVRQITLPTTAGVQTFEWDGLDADGGTASSGTYYIDAIANVDGTSESLTTEIAGSVSSVSFDSSGTSLTLNTPELGTVSISDVTRVM